MDSFQFLNLTTYEQFKAHGMDSAEPMITEFKRLFLAPKGDYSTCVSAFMAARVLDTLCAHGMDTEPMIDAIKSLHHFGFKEFRHGRGIIEDMNMIEELPKYRAVIASTSESFWSGVEGAFKYDAKLAKQAKENPEKYGNQTWRWRWVCCWKIIW